MGNAGIVAAFLREHKGLCRSTTERPAFPASPIRILRYDSTSDELTRLEEVLSVQLIRWCCIDPLIWQGFSGLASTLPAIGKPKPALMLFFPNHNEPFTREKTWPM